MYIMCKTIWWRFKKEICLIILLEKTQVCKCIELKTSESETVMKNSQYHRNMLWPVWPNKLKINI